MQEYMKLIATPWIGDLRFSSTAEKIYWIFGELAKKQEVEELEYFENNSDDHDTPSAWNKLVLLKLTIQPFCNDFL